MNDKPCKVHVWGTMPPPFGGVARSFEAARSLSTASPWLTTVDMREPLPVLAGLLGRGSHVVYVSGPRSLQAAALLSKMKSGVIPFIHGGSVPTFLDAAPLWVRRAFLRKAADGPVWVTNAHLAAWVRSLAPGDGPVDCVSAWPSSHAVIDASREEVLGDEYLLVAAARGAELYGVDIAAEAVSVIRRVRPGLRLKVVLYDDLDAYGLSTAARLNEVSWIDVHRDVAPSDVVSLLSHAEALLRPTSTDGDSGLIREAQSLGTRIIASDVVPRPAGVELCGRSADEFVKAFVEGGAISNGEGLGIPLDAALQRLASRSESWTRRP